MGTYIQPTDLLERGAERLAQAAGPDDGPALGADALRLQLGGEDLTDYAYDPAMVTAAASAETVIEAAISRAESELDNACRDRYLIPLDVLDGGSRGMLLDMAWAYVYRSGRPQDVEDGLKAAETRLGRIMRGDIRLPASAASSGAGSGMPEYEADEAGVSEDDLDDFLRR